MKKFVLISDVDGTLLQSNLNHSLINKEKSAKLLWLLQDTSIHNNFVTPFTGQSAEEFVETKENIGSSVLSLFGSSAILEDGFLHRYNGYLSTLSKLSAGDITLLSIIKEFISNYFVKIDDACLNLYSSLGIPAEKLKGRSCLPNGGSLAVQLHNAQLPTIFVRGNEKELEEAGFPLRSLVGDLQNALAVLLAKSIIPLHVANMSNETIKVMPEGIDKGSALSTLRDTNILPPPISDYHYLGFGDGTNDIPLALKIQEYGGDFIAVGNATDDLKAVSNIVLSPNAIALSGVLSFLEEKIS